MLSFVTSFEFITGLVAGVVFAIPLKALYNKLKAKFQAWRASSE